MQTYYGLTKIDVSSNEEIEEIKPELDQALMSGISKAQQHKFDHVLMSEATEAMLQSNEC